MKKNVKIFLVNLISEDYLARYQAPLAVNVLSSYFRTVLPDFIIDTIDMQDVFKRQTVQDGTIEEIFMETINIVAGKITAACSDNKFIIGLSVKWSTQKVAGKIIEKVRQQLAPNNWPLFVIGNIRSTHGYRELLVKKDFSGILAVVGEGEEALVNIAKIAFQTKNDFRMVANYKELDNVAIFFEGTVHVGSLKRIDLSTYPTLNNVAPAEIYDQEWDVYALETSRGCPWGNCTFCSIKKQFGTSESSGKNPIDWRWQAFPMTKILNEISRFARLGVRRFDIKDSEFIGPVRTTEEFSQTVNRIKDFANGIIALNEEIRCLNDSIHNNTISITHISARVDTIYSDNPLEEKRNMIRKNSFALLKAAGLRRVYLGIESGSSSQLKRYGKGVSVKENKQAIKILRELGLEIEVGFIFFDYLSSLEELIQNISFIEETRIYETDSRILGSLRIQKGSPYEAIAERSGIIGREDSDQLSYEASFVNKEVAAIEVLFSDWEKSTRKLIKIIPSHLRIENYKMDFAFIKDVIACHEADRKDWLYTTVEAHCASRTVFFNSIKQAFDKGMFGRQNPKIFLEYLESARMENSILVEEMAHVRYNGGY